MESGHEFRILSIGIVENCQQQVGGVNFVAFEHTGFERTKFDNASGQIAETDIRNAYGALIVGVSSGVEEGLVEIFSQLIGRGALGCTVDQACRLAFNIGEKRQQQVFRHDIAGVMAGGLSGRVAYDLLEIL